MNQKRMDKFCSGGIPKNVRVYDNGGESTDRYTVVFSGRYRHKTGGEFTYLGMSASPFHPQGVGMHGSSQVQIDAPQGWPPAIGRKCHLGRRIRFEDLPEDCQRCVLQDYLTLWGICDEFEVAEVLKSIAA